VLLYGKLKFGEMHRFLWKEYMIIYNTTSN